MVDSKIFLGTLEDPVKDCFVATTVLKRPAKKLMKADSALSLKQIRERRPLADVNSRLRTG